MEISADHIDVYAEKVFFSQEPREGGVSKLHKVFDVLQVHTPSVVPPQCGMTETARWLDKTFALEKQRKAAL